MFSKRRCWFYFFSILNGVLLFFQETEGNGSSTGAATGKTHFFYQLPTYPRDCKEVLDQCQSRNSSGVFLIKPDGSPHPFEVYCNNSFESGGWTVFMRRINGSLIFSRNWGEYKRGFGFLSSEFWLGNEKLAFLTNQQRYQLCVDVITSNGSRGIVKYNFFRVGDEWGNYALATLGNATRDTEMLMSTCPTNMIYTNCTCERTCEAPTVCQDNCEEASKCVCPGGFFLRGGDCVAPEECQCYSSTADTIIPMGESYINSQCTQNCSCNGSSLSCSNYGCDPNATCTGIGKRRQCVCNAGLIGDGRECRCPANMIYKICTCERTCEAPTICQDNCQDASTCVCSDGFFLKGSDCVTPQECQCYVTTADKVIPVGESYINNMCSEQCSCSRSGLSCTNYRCDSRARCSSTSGEGRCVCTAGFIGNGLECRCNTGFLADGSRCRRPRDCDEVASVEGYSGSGLYYILPSNWQQFWVYCNMSEGRWTVFQRRIPGSGRNFRLSWNSYKGGFGDLDQDFWLGNDRIYYLTSQRNYQLRIDLIDSANRHYRAQYNGFRIGSEGNQYYLAVLGSFSGNAGFDAMRHHHSLPFTTYDRDNGDYYGYRCCDRNCACLHAGAWWYKYRDYTTSGACDRHDCSQFYYYSDHETCTYSNLNGKANGNSGETIFWHGLSGNDCGIKYTEMKIRPL